MNQLQKIALALLAIAAATCVPTSAQPPAPTDAVPAASDAADEPSPIVDTNPAIRAALEIPRKTPADYFQSVMWLIELDRPELAKPILDELAKLQMTDAQRADLVVKFGSRAMLQLAQSKELAPAGAQFADACMNAAAAASNDPKRIAALVAQLTDPSIETRVIARNDLAATGQPGVIATLEALAKESNPARRVAIANAAAQMNPLVVGPLLAMLDTSDPALRSIVAGILQNLSVQQAIPLLPQTSQSAERTITSALENYRRGTPPFAVDEANQVELWQWNDATKKLSSTRYPADEARIIWMARLARDLGRYHPENHAYTQQALLLDLEAAALLDYPQSPALDYLQYADLNARNQILADALASNYTHAAVAAADALGERGNADVLYSADSQPTPLAAALRSPNRHVRFAALAAIMKLDPKSPYPGSSRVPETLAWFAAGTGERRAIVAMPTDIAATDLAGMLAADGLRADAIDRGREAVDRALETPDLEMIFVDVNINGPGIREVIYELRINPTTAEIPIAILAPTSRLAAAEQIAAEHKRIVAAPRVRSPEVLGGLIERLTDLSGRFAAPPDERATQAVDALTWLSELAAGERPFYKIRRTEPVIEAALYGTTAAEPAIAALAVLGTPESQRALVNFASQPTLPIEIRAQAADAFRKNVAARGVLLTSGEILTQYDRYNASERADARTQRILGSLLDAIESRRGADVELPLPPQP
jgi:CheY-like chemotaxis protein